jgi:hypothetical protein
VRAGAIPLLVWGVLIGVLFAIHAVWTHDTLQDGSFGFAIGLIARDRDTIRRGAPEVHAGVEAVPVASLGAVITAAAVVACGFGFVFGSFLVFIAAGLFVAGMFVLGRELTGERRARRTWSTRERER